MLKAFFKVVFCIFIALYFLFNNAMFETSARFLLYLFSTHCPKQGLISNKSSVGALKFFQTLRSSNVSHFIHLEVFQKVDALY